MQDKPIKIRKTWSINPRTRLGKIKRFEIKDGYLDELMGMKLKEDKGEIPSTDEDLMIDRCKKYNRFLT